MICSLSGTSWTRAAGGGGGGSNDGVRRCPTGRPLSCPVYVRGWRDFVFCCCVRYRRGRRDSRADTTPFRHRYYRYPPKGNWVLFVRPNNVIIRRHVSNFVGPYSSHLNFFISFPVHNPLRGTFNNDVTHTVNAIIYI